MDGNETSLRPKPALSSLANAVCTTSGCQHIQHPDVGMFNIRVSYSLTPGCRATLPRNGGNLSLPYHH